MVTTPKLGIPLISGQQSQPEVTHNQMVLVLQAVLGGAIAKQNAPPGSPNDGDCYVVGTAGSGLWAGHNNAIAIFYGGWIFLPGVDDDGVQIAMGADQEGLHLYIRSLDLEQVWTGAAWVDMGGGGGSSYLQDLLDVQVGNTSTEDGDFLMWDESLQKWIAAPISFPSSGGGGVDELSQLDDVEISSPQDGDVLTFDELLGKWINEAASSQSSGGDAGEGHVPTYQVLTASGTYNRPDGVVQIRVRMCGGGAGGQGVSGSAFVNGAAGGDTTFKDIVAAGGAIPPGTNANGNNGGLGGTGGSNGTGATSILRARGNGGGAGNNVATVSNTISGHGGGSAFFGGGSPGAGSNAAQAGVSASANTGGGGSGAFINAPNVMGGAGGGGGESVEFSIENPASSYSYTIGAGGAGGASTQNGGAGGSGVIIVEEIYSTAASEGGLDLPQVTVITASGTYNTPAGATQLRVRMVGGGGGGGGAGTASQTAGGNGGTSIFGTVQAAGGTGGPVNTGSGGAGGTGGSGTATARFKGGGGGGGMTSTASTSAPGPVGGSSIFGAGGAAAGAAAANTGGGGGGGNIGTVAGGFSGSGGGGGEGIELIIDNPAASYSVTIGAAGTAGGAGTSGNAGGAGGSGVIIVEALFSSGLMGYVPGQLEGTATNDDAAAGMVGEYFETEVLSGAAVAMTTATPMNVASRLLPAGDFDVWGFIQTNVQPATALVAFVGWTSLASASVPTAPNKGAYNFFNANQIGTGDAVYCPIGAQRIKLSAPANVYLSASAAFSGGTMAAFGIICARRRR